MTNAEKVLAEQAFKNLVMKIGLIGECLKLLTDKFHNSLVDNPEYSILGQYILESAHIAKADICDDMDTIEQALFGEGHNIYIGDLIAVPKGIEIRSNIEEEEEIEESV